jgi:hypothetical protein
VWSDVVRSSEVAFEGSDELGQVVTGDPAQLANLDAAELSGAEKVVHLVPSDVQHFRDLLDCVCLQWSPPRVVAGVDRGFLLSFAGDGA